MLGDNPDQKLLLILNETIATPIYTALSYHYSTTLTLSGWEGLTLAELLQPTLIILSTELTDLTGFAVCRMLKRMSNGLPSPLVLMVDSLEPAATGLDNMQKACAAGTDYYHLLPIGNTKSLLVLLEFILNPKGKIYVNYLKHCREYPPGTSTFAARANHADGA